VVQDQCSLGGAQAARLLLTEEPRNRQGLIREVVGWSEFDRTLSRRQRSIE
jgi:hypothetical protein